MQREGVRDPQTSPHALFCNCGRRFLALLRFWLLLRFFTSFDLRPQLQNNAWGDSLAHPLSLHCCAFSGLLAKGVKGEVERVVSESRPP